MQLTSPWNTTQAHRNLVLEMLETHDSVGGVEIRKALGCTALNVHLVMDDLITEGLVQSDTRGAIRYSKRSFTFDPQRVKEEWFVLLKNWFQGGKSETARAVAQQLQLNLLDVQATLEAMRQRGWLHGRFVGRMCIYALLERGTTLQGTSQSVKSRLNGPVGVLKKIPCNMQS